MMINQASNPPSLPSEDSSSSTQPRPPSRPLDSFVATSTLSAPSAPINVLQTQEDDNAGSSSLLTVCIPSKTQPMDTTMSASLQQEAEVQVVNDLYVMPSGFTSFYKAAGRIERRISREDRYFHFLVIFPSDFLAIYFLLSTFELFL